MGEMKGVETGLHRQLAIDKLEEIELFKAVNLLVRYKNLHTLAQNIQVFAAAQCLETQFRSRLQAQNVRYIVLGDFQLQGSRDFRDVVPISDVDGFFGEQLLGELGRNLFCR